MAVAQFNGCVTLTDVNLTDVSSTVGSKQSWLATFDFRDNSGKYLGTNVAVGDVVILDTGAVDTATITSYQISSVISATFNSFRARIEYDVNNSNPSGAPDISSSIGLPGAVVRKSPTIGLSNVVDASLQLIPSSVSSQLLNDNLTQVLDKMSTGMLQAASTNTPSAVVVRDSNGSFNANAVTVNSLTTTNLNFSGTGPVTIASSNDINLSATGMITLGAVTQLPSKTKAQLLAITSVPAGTIAFCSNTVSGAVPVYFNGTAWLKMFDNGAI